jgi:CHASE3 domain sensor protein
MNFLRKNKLFQREKMQQLKAKDYLKVVVIVGIIVIPLLVGLAV